MNEAIPKAEGASARASAEAVAPRGLPGTVAGPWTSPVCVALFALLLSCYAYVHQDFSGGTSISRLDLLHALFTEGTLRIDSYHANTSDKALFEGHYYSDKAPGAAVLALPGFAFATVLLRMTGSGLDTPDGWLFSSWLATATSAGLITALGGVLCFVWLSRWIDSKLAMLTTVALFLGSLPFPYATMLFSHGTVAALLAVAVWALDDGEAFGPPLGPGSPGPGRLLSPGVREASAPRRSRSYPGTVQGRRFERGRRRRCVLAGLCCGWVLASEFTAGLVVAALAVVVIARGRGGAPAFGFAAIPPLLLIPLYSWLCFGTPFTLGYSHQAHFPQMHRGLFGIQWPDLATALKLLGSTDRGLFFWSPFLLLALAGYGDLWRRSRRWFWLCSLVPLAQVVVISGNTWDWRAGWTLGPRYLAPVLPLLALPTALGVGRLPRLGLALVIVSLLFTGLGTVVDATPRYEIGNPLTELHLPGLLGGRFTYNLGQAFGLGGWSLLPLLGLVAVYGWQIWRGLADARAQPAAAGLREKAPTER